MLATSMIVDEWDYSALSENRLLNAYPSFDDYKRIRRGRKHYGFVPKARPNDVVKNYYCSWPEADRRFKLMLITRRLMK